MLYIIAATLNTTRLSSAGGKNAYGCRPGRETDGRDAGGKKLRNIDTA